MTSYVDVHEMSLLLVWLRGCGGAGVGVLSYIGYVGMFRYEGHGFQISLHSVNQTLYQSNLRSFECRTDCFVALLIFQRPPWEQKESSHCREVETRVNVWTVHQKNGRWWRFDCAMVTQTTKEVDGLRKNLISFHPIMAGTVK